MGSRLVEIEILVAVYLSFPKSLISIKNYALADNYYFTDPILAKKVTFFMRY
jgi:hypothetical protein